MSNAMPATKVLTGWRKGVIARKIRKWEAKGYVLAGPVQFGQYGAQSFVATMMLPQQPAVPPTPTVQQAP